MPAHAGISTHRRLDLAQGAALDETQAFMETLARFGHHPRIDIHAGIGAVRAGARRTALTPQGQQRRRIDAPEINAGWPFARLGD